MFNAAQVDGAPELNASPPTPLDPTPTFDRFVAATGAVVRMGDAAYYLPSRDEIRMPNRTVFRSTEGYCGTLSHELIHWTSASHRLDRQLTTCFGTRAYAAEELVAELGAAFVLAGLGIAPEPHPNHAAYMAGWMPLLRDDARALVTAASLASRAAQFLEAFSQPATDTEIAA
ncbi:zincin-like metallopeptidase domain-containing protein [Methylobacterium sp.]|uniref:zincin-like metallopeptidase domain-containing protein n=1 Tax=Methylobacterium sp. TaxID=409 RepID=UPI0025F7E4EB|nr:zincin-like metallopeptidase domain-containing protein [Methylobacterium sp.]